MSEAEEGFLADSIGDFRFEVRRKYADFYNLLRRVNRFAVPQQFSFSINRENNAEIYASLFYVRTLSHVQAAALLLEQGLVTQVVILLRAAMETMITLSAIAKNPDVADRLNDNYLVQQKRIAKNLDSLAHPELQSIVNEDRAAGFFEKFKKISVSETKVADLVKIAALEDWHRTAYAVYSWAVHSNPMDLQQHAVMEGDQVKEFKNERQLEDQDQYWCCAIELLIMAMKAASEIFPKIDKEIIERLNESLYAIAKSTK